MKFPRVHGCRLLTAGWLVLVAGQAMAAIPFDAICAGAALFPYWPLFWEKAQAAAPTEPYWLRLDVPEWSVGMEVEGLTEGVSVGSSSSTHEQLSLTPLLGMRYKGSIYHPNLMTFNLSGEGGWSWLTDEVKGTGSSSSRNENGDLLRYLAQVNLLSGKPYNATFSASQDHTYRNYDSFTTYTVDTTRYGGHAGWRTENLSLNADVSHRDEDSTGINGSTRFSETYANFSGIQTRETGQSSLTYRYNEFDTIVGTGGSRSSTTHAVGVSDSETFGSRRQISATTGASYSQSEYSGQQTEMFSASESITVKHRPKLDSFLNANFSHSRLGPFISSFLLGQAGVRHQLYESLTSTLDAHGNYDESSGSGTAASNRRYGLGLSENYTKRLGDWGRLSLSANISADHEEHESSGTVLTTIDERHDLARTGGAIDPFRLNNPRVIVATIQVRDSNGIIVPTILYTTSMIGELTQIELLSDPSLSSVTYVTVSYQSESLYNAAFESLNGGAQIRLDLPGRVGIYVRLNWLENNAPPHALTQTLTDLVGGVDYTWRGLRAGAEFEDYDSNFVQYQAWRFFQSYNYQTSGGSTLGVDFTQNFYRYANNFSQDRYQFISRYNTLLTSSLAWNVEGGYALQNVMTTDQDFAFARTGLTWTRGKLSVRAGYEFNYQTTTTGSSTEERNRNHFYTYLKRTF